MRGEAGKQAHTYYRAAEQVPLLPVLRPGDAQAIKPEDYDRNLGRYFPA